MTTLLQITSSNLSLQFSYKQETISDYDTFINMKQSMTTLLP